MRQFRKNTTISKTIILNLILRTKRALPLYVITLSYTGNDNINPMLTITLGIWGPALVREDGEM